MTSNSSESQALGVALSAEERQVRSRLLSAMRREIEATVMPDLNTAYSKLAASWVCQTIDYLLLEEHPSMDWVVARDALFASLPKVAEPAGQYLPDVHDPKRSIDALAAAVRQVGKSIRPEIVGKIGAIALDGFRAEARFIEERRTAALKKLSDVEVDATAERFDRFFNSTKEFAGYRTQTIERMVGGYSRDTFIVEALTQAGVNERFAVRRDLPFGPVEASAADEYTYLDRLRALGIPVARPRAAVRDRSFIGEPFLLTDCIPGAVATEPMGADRAVGEVGAREMARILARLHCIDPHEVGLATVSQDPRMEIAASIDYWRRRWRRYRCLESEVMEAAFAWLDDNVPRRVPRSVIIHGDYRPGNALMVSGKISAVLDWEFIHPGDAAEDVEYIKMYIQPFLDTDEFMKEYLSAGGVEYEPASADFYEVFRSVRNVVCTDTSWYGFLTGAYPSMRLSWQGTTARRWLMMYLAEALKKVTAK
jgi:aminoglycoside phosphotransferase (APT) family kinase protein